MIDEAFVFFHRLDVMLLDHHHALHDPTRSINPRKLTVADESIMAMLEVLRAAAAQVGIDSFTGKPIEATVPEPKSALEMFPADKPATAASTAASTATQSPAPKTPPAPAPEAVAKAADALTTATESKAAPVAEKPTQQGSAVPVSNRNTPAGQQGGQRHGGQHGGQGQGQHRQEQPRAGR